MLNPIVSCTVYAVEMLIVYLFFTRITERCRPVIICFILGLAYFEFGSLINLLFHNSTWINTVTCAFIISIFAITCFHIRPHMAVIYSVILNLLNYILEIVGMLLLSGLFFSNNIDYNSSPALLLTMTLICKSLWFLTCLLLSSAVKGNSDVARKLTLHLLYYPITTTICLIVLYYLCVNIGMEENIRIIFSLLSLILFASNIILFLNYQHQLETDSEYLRILSENHRLQTEKSYYDILEKQNQQLMIYAHDTKNHLAAIQSAVENPQVQNYVKELSDQLTEYTRSCHSGNMMLDVMINKYVTACEMQNISFDYDVKTCNLNNMEDMDLVAVLGNLMDNALTSAGESAQKKISLSTTTRNGFSVTIISNSCDSSPKLQGTHLISSKKEKSLHGYGLKSVSRTLKKYDGGFDWDYDEVTHMFTTTVMIKDLHE